MMQSVSAIEQQDVSDSLKSFESRWRYAVFPAMVTFVLLIGFMFYLIYGMLQRMEDLSRDIHHMSGVISEALPVMQGGVVGMSARMQFVGEDVKKMAGNMNEMSDVLVQIMPKLENRISEMSGNISDMTVATSSMAMTTHNMGQSMWDMNRNISKPFSAMNKMIPWSRSDQPPRPLAPPIYYPNQIQTLPTAQTTVPTQPAASTVAVVNTTARNSSGENKYHGFCASCHGVDAKGGVGPSLEGKSVDYIIQVLGEYRQGIRKGTMVGVVETLTDDDIHNVASYLGSEG